MKFHIADMSCGHCTASIEKALQAADTSAVFQPDLASRTAHVSSTLSVEDITKILADAGYPATVQEDGV